MNKRQLVTAIIALATSFSIVTVGVLSGATTEFDRYAILAFQTGEDSRALSGPDWLSAAIRNLSAIGSIPILLMVVGIAYGYFVLSHERHAARQIFIAFLGAIIWLNVLKWLIGRARPDFVEPMGATFTSSFPSGHALLSITTYLTLGLNFARSAPDRRVGRFMISACLALTAIAGVSRVYLGLHFPSDVLAGWCLGAAWTLCCAAAFTRDELPPTNSARSAAGHANVDQPRD